MPVTEIPSEGMFEPGRWNMPTSDPIPGDESQQAELKRLTAALALAERDRQLLGYEIHDGIVQDLTAAAMYLEGNGHAAQLASAESQESAAVGLRLLRDAIAAARRLIRGLATVELDDRGLVSALERLAEKFRTEHALPVFFSNTTSDLSLPASAQHLLLRIAQESLYNAWKHAQAHNIQLRLSATAEQLELSITDDGIGFDPTQVFPNHFGLEGMRTRAGVLGADLQIDSQPGHGTRITVRLPWRFPCSAI
jgi:signal transduction histidine kinase